MFKARGLKFSPELAEAQWVLIHTLFELEPKLKKKSAVLTAPLSLPKPQVWTPIVDYFLNISIVHMKFSFEFVIYARSLAKSGIKSARVKKVSFIDPF